MTSHDIGARAPAKPWLYALAVFVFTIGAYLPALGGSFIWDDHYLITRSPSVTTLQPLSSYFRSSFWQHEDLAPGERAYYRPLTVLSFALDHALHGSNPGGYHVTNLCLHAATALLLFAMLRRRNMTPPAAFLGAVGWAWFPRLSEAAAWISGRTDILAALFTLLGLSLWSRRSPVARTFAAVCFLLGLFAKEVAVAGVLAALAWSWTDSAGEPKRKRLAGLVPVVLPLAVYLALRLQALGLPRDGGDLPWSLRLLHVPEALGRYVAMLLNAWTPGIQLGTLGHPTLGYVALGVVAVLVGAFAALRLRSRLTLDGFDRAAVTLGCVSLGLVLHVLPIPVLVVAADRFLYLPTLALVLLAAPRLAAVLQVSKRWWRVAAVVYVLSFAPLTWLRARAWSDEVEFWSIAFRAQHEGNNALSRLELGNIYARAGLFSRACALYLDADEGDYANFLLARNNAANEFVSMGEPERAVPVLEDLVARAPEVPKFWLGLAVAYGASERWSDSQRALGEALQRFPTYGAAVNLRQAIREHQQRSSTAYPDTIAGQLARAQAATGLMRTADAMQALLRASKLGSIPASEWTSLLVYAFKEASFGQLEALFKRYSEQHTPDPVLITNFEERRARVAELRELWSWVAPQLRAATRSPAAASEP